MSLSPLFANGGSKKALAGTQGKNVLLLDGLGQEKQNQRISFSCQLCLNILHQGDLIVFCVDLLFEVPFLRFGKPLHFPFDFLALTDRGWVVRPRETWSAFG